MGGIFTNKMSLKGKWFCFCKLRPTCLPHLEIMIQVHQQTGSMCLMQYLNLHFKFDTLFTSPRKSGQSQILIHHAWMMFLALISKFLIVESWLSFMLGKMKQSKMRCMLFTKGMLDLKATGFPFFLYGSVAWERKRKVWLSDRLLLLGRQGTLD